MNEQFETYGTNEAFYLHGGVRLPEYIAQPISDGRSVPLISKTPLLSPEGPIDSALVDEKMKEIAMNRRVIEFGGNTFDISTVNNESAVHGTMSHNSTYNSSLDNTGNGYELAVAAVRYPNHRLVYIATPGNGASNPMPGEDADYFRTTGRLVRGEGDEAQPVSYIANMHRALSTVGIDVTHLMGTDSAGGHYARALATAMESDQLEAAHFSETSGFINLGRTAIALGMVVTEDRKYKKWNIERSVDPEKMSADKQERYAKAVELYSSIAAMHQIDENRSGLPQKVSALRTSLQGLRHGPYKGKNPLADDSNALLARQPNARLVYSLAELDPLYQDPQRAHNAVRKFISSLIVPATADVRAIMVPNMTHNINTYFPELYHAIKRYALLERDAA